MCEIVLHSDLRKNSTRNLTTSVNHHILFYFHGNLLNLYLKFGGVALLILKEVLILKLSDWKDYSIVSLGKVLFQSFLELFEETQQNCGRRNAFLVLRTSKWTNEYILLLFVKFVLSFVCKNSQFMIFVLDF